MNIWISYDGDDIGRLAGAARLSNDISEVRKVSQRIEAGNRVFQSFVDSILGAEIGEIGGDEGCFSIPADKITEIPAIAKKYYEVTGHTVTIGAGMNISESSKALLIGKVVNGKANLTIWRPEMEDEIREIAEHPISEEQKQHEAYLGADDSDYLHKAADPGEIQKRLQPSVSTAKAQPSLPPVQAPTEGEQPQEAPVNHEEEFHNFAQEQGARDLNDRTHSKENLEQIKKELVEVLQTVRQQLPNIAQLQQVAPDAYNSIINLVQGVVALGKETMSRVPELQKSEDLIKGISEIAPGTRVSSKLEPHPRAEGAKVFSRTFDYSHLLHPDMKNSGFQLHVEHKNTMLPKGVKSIATSMTSPNIMPVRPTETIRSVLRAPNGADIGTVTGHVNKKGQNKAIEPHSDLDAPYRGKGLGTAMYEATYAHAKSTGVNRVQGGVHSPDAHALHTRLAKKHGFHYKSSKEVDPKTGEEVSDDFFPYKAYSYALKSEDHIENENGFIGKGHGPIFYRDDEIAKDEEDPGQGDAEEGAARRTGANAGGAQSGRAHVKLPVGTTYQGKTKIINGETGKAGWRSVKGGAIASQLHNPPILGANSTATSANNPDR